MSEPRRYYVQEMPRSFRRYNPAEIWKPVDRIWVAQCAPEAACLRTGDTLMTEEQFKKAYPKIPL